MSNKIYAVSMLSAALFLAACEGDDGTNGTDGANGSDGFNSLIAIRDIPKGDAVCLGGGKAADSGLDLNRNDILDAGEVTATEILECAATPTVRALHASPDAPAVNIIVNGTAALTDVPYAAGSGFVPVIESNTIQVQAITPDGANPIVIDQSVALDYSTEATIIATGTVDPTDDGLGVFALPIINPSDERITQGFFRAQVVHGSPSAPPVNVYVTGATDDLASSTPVNGTGTPLAFEGFTPQLERPEGDYRIRVVADGDATLTPVFDTGDTPITLAAGADLLIVAIDNTGPGASPVDLIVLDGTAATQIEDAATPASAIAVHLSPDAPAVDILADDTSTPADDAIPLVRNVSFGEFCDLNAIPAPADYTLSVVANADNSIVATQFSLGVQPSTQATAIVTGFLDLNQAGLTPAITTLPQIADRRSIATETKLTVTHGSPSTGPVDIYLVPAGTDITNVDPDFSDVPFGADTTQLSVANDFYDAIVTGAGSKTPAIELLNLDFTAGGSVLNVIARDLAAGGLDPNPLIIDMTNVPVCPTP
ncbi:MAG: DUF4397 domain-containing protein [Woeseiaceae bacterium]